MPPPKPGTRNPEPVFTAPGVTLYCADCRELLPALGPDRFEAIVTDPPYGLGFMGRQWDHGLPGEPFWRAVLAAALPGAHLLAFGGTRTWHRLAVAIEDAGWTIRDTLCWLYGQGFPKSHDISKAIDKAAGAEREVVGSDPRPIGYDGHPGGGPVRPFPATAEAAEWDGWGTALKPAWEPVVLAMKPLDGTFAHNALTHGLAGLAIDKARIGVSADDENRRDNASYDSAGGVTLEGKNAGTHRRLPTLQKGRWPANLALAHHPLCRPRGTKRVKGTEHRSEGQFPKHRAHASGYSGEWGDHVSSRGYADPDGLETVEAWDCVVALDADGQPIYQSDLAPPPPSPSSHASRITHHVPLCPVAALDLQSGELISGELRPEHNCGDWGYSGGERNRPTDKVAGGDRGGASRFFYTAKASPREREDGLRGQLPCIRCGQLDSRQHITHRRKGKPTETLPLGRAGRDGVPDLDTIEANKRRRGYTWRLARCIRNGHPTVKPLDLMRWLVRLTSTPSGGLLCDPFCGSGTTLVACILEGRPCIGIEQDAESIAIAVARCRHALQQRAQELPLWEWAQERSR